MLVADALSWPLSLFCLVKLYFSHCSGEAVSVTAIYAISLVNEYIAPENFQEYSTNQGCNSERKFLTISKINLHFFFKTGTPSRRRSWWRYSGHHNITELWTDDRHGLEVRPRRHSTSLLRYLPKKFCKAWTFDEAFANSQERQQEVLLWILPQSLQGSLRACPAHQETHWRLPFQVRLL